MNTRSSLKPGKPLLALALALVFVVTSSFHSTKRRCDCDGLAGQALGQLKKFSIMKEYQVYLPEFKRKSEAKVMKEEVVLHKGVRYKFITIQNKKYEGVPILTIYNNPKMEFLVGTNYNSYTKRFAEAIEFECQASGTYCLAMSFQDGMEGCAVVLTSFMKDY